MERVNYFLFNIRTDSTNSVKLEIWVIYTQMEVGLFSQFFPEPFVR